MVTVALFVGKLADGDKVDEPVEDDEAEGVEKTVSGGMEVFGDTVADRVKDTDDVGDTVPEEEMENELMKPVFVAENESDGDEDTLNDVVLVLVTRTEDEVDTVAERDANEALSDEEPDVDTEKDDDDVEDWLRVAVTVML